MDFANERYVRLYVRDTLTWEMLGFEGQTVLALLLRKLDRSGVLDIGEREPAKALSAILRGPDDFVAIGLERLLSEKVLELGEHCLVMPNFLDAQETPQSDAQRCREYRARRREKARDTKRVIADTKRVTNDTERHAATRGDTERHSFLPSQSNSETSSLVVSPAAKPTKAEVSKAEVSPEEIVEAWKRLCVPKGAPDVREITGDRRKKMQLRIREHPTFAWWDELFSRAARTPFLFGGGNRGWRASFDWLIDNQTNAVKILEGRYDNASRRTETAGIWGATNRAP